MTAFDSNQFINPHQVGGIDSYVIDNGDGRGSRVCEVNTGSGLRYRVLVDRGLDIDRAFMNELSLSYLTHRGATAPTRGLDRDADWLQSFPGGLLTSCGPFNTGAPATDNGQVLGLHGTHSNTPAEIESIRQPDPHRGEFDMSITAVVRYGAFYGPNLTLRRTIRSRLGESFIDIQDTFENRGNTPLDHAWLLHINFGYPLLDAGCEFRTDVDAEEVRDDAGSKAYFSDPKTALIGQPPRADHDGAGHAFRYLTIKPHHGTRGRAAIWNAQRRLGVQIDYDTAQFPRLGQWVHWGRHEYVAALEPMTGGVTGRDDDRRRGWIRQIAPGASQSYGYQLTVINHLR